MQQHVKLFFHRYRQLVLACAVAAFTTTSSAEDFALMESPTKLKKLSLEELLEVEITSVSKREERISEAPASIHVITEEDIRRSGAQSIPEALRLAPNLQVAQSDARQWAISSRGFNGDFANKLLVLMDGRALYTPLFSGVFWDAQDYLLPDLERIEVISGPGATLWGANAVNGVINIISKSARDTQGFLAEAGAGTEHRGFGGLRYGGKLAENVYYRVYGKYHDRDDTVLRSGASGADSWEMGQGGMRVDWDIDDDNTLTVQGDGYSAVADQVRPGDVKFSGGNVLGRWVHQFPDDARLQVQLYYDRTQRTIPGTASDHLDTYDTEAQYQFSLGERNAFVTGVGYRLLKDHVRNSPGFGFLPSRLSRNVFNAFIQDEITLMEDRLKLTLGSKFEHNDYTGFEYQPSARLAWIAGRHVVWGAVSRAVRTPSRIDRHLFSAGTPPLFGGPDFDSEKLIAYEIGYRVRPHDKVFVNLAAYYNTYDEARSLQITPGAIVIANGMEGNSFGTEAELTVQPIESWRVTAGYAWLRQDFNLKSGHVDSNETIDPRQQFLLRSTFDLPKNFELDCALRYVDALHAPRGGTVPSYMTLDLRLGWEATKNLEFALVGQNLLDDQHPEFGTSRASRREIQRGFYGKVTWRF